MDLFYSASQLPRSVQAVQVVCYVNGAVSDTVFSCALACVCVRMQECDGNGQSSILEALLEVDCIVHHVPLPDKI